MNTAASNPDTIGVCECGVAEGANAHGQVPSAETRHICKCNETPTPTPTPTPAHARTRPRALMLLCLLVAAALFGWSRVIARLGLGQVSPANVHHQNSNLELQPQPRPQPQPSSRFNTHRDLSDVAVRWQSCGPPAGSSPASASATTFPWSHTGSHRARESTAPSAAHLAASSSPPRSLFPPNLELGQSRWAPQGARVHMLDVSSDFHIHSGITWFNLHCGPQQPREHQNHAVRTCDVQWEHLLRCVFIQTQTQARERTVTVTRQQPSQQQPDHETLIVSVNVTGTASVHMATRGIQSLYCHHPPWLQQRPFTVLLSWEAAGQQANITNTHAGPPVHNPTHNTNANVHTDTSSSSSWWSSAYGCWWCWSSSPYMSFSMCAVWSRVYGVAVCTNPLRNAGVLLNLVEWIEYQYMIGVEHIYLYDRFNEFYHQVQPYTKCGRLTHVHFPLFEIGYHNHSFYDQTMAGNQCILQHQHNTRYMLMIDVDEYLHFPSTSPFHIRTPHMHIHDHIHETVPRDPYPYPFSSSRAHWSCSACSVTVSSMSEMGPLHECCGMGVVGFTDSLTRSISDSEPVMDFKAGYMMFHQSHIGPPVPHGAGRDYYRTVQPERTFMERSTRLLVPLGQGPAAPKYMIRTSPYMFHAAGVHSADLYGTRSHPWGLGFVPSSVVHFLHLKLGGGMPAPEHDIAPANGTPQVEMPHIILAYLKYYKHHGLTICNASNTMDTNHMMRNGN